MTASGRFLALEARRPVHVEWELTPACDVKCRHCRSRVGPARRGERSTGECLALVRALAGLGTRHVTLIGGEAPLRQDWIVIVRAIRDAGLDCALQTGGLHLTPERLDRAAEAGLQGVGMTVDGLRRLHDRLRGIRGSYEAALAALRHAKARGLSTTASTNVTGPAIRQLRPLFERLVAAGVDAWQVQLAVDMGGAADRPELLLQPHQLLELMPLLAGLYREGLEQGLLLRPGSNVGYFGPFESLWRAGGDERVHRSGCCAAQAAAPEPRGLCGTCYYAEVCQGGPGNNPYCHHRALALRARGLRERVEAADGRFQLILETLDGRKPPPGQPAKLGPAAPRPEPEGGPARRLVLCPGCRCHVFAGTRRCPHCGGDRRALAREHARRKATARAAYAEQAALMTQV